MRDGFRFNLRLRTIFFIWQYYENTDFNGHHSVVLDTMLCILMFGILLVFILRTSRSSRRRGGDSMILGGSMIIASALSKYAIGAIANILVAGAGQLKLGLQVTLTAGFNRPGRCDGSRRESTIARQHCDLTKQKLVVTFLGWVTFRNPPVPRWSVLLVGLASLCFSSEAVFRLRLPWI